jgi:hypothetical protein
VDPIVRVTGVTSSGSGTIISVTIPAAAGVGDVMVNKSGSGGATLSNAFPTNLTGTFGTPPPTGDPDLTSVNPSSIDALIPGTGKTITLTGTNLSTVTDVLCDGSPVDVSLWSLVNSTTITLDMPQVATLGAHTLGVTNGTITDNLAVSIVAPATPKLQWGTGDSLNSVTQSGGLDMTLGGTPGSVHGVFGSSIAPPGAPRYLRDSLTNVLRFPGVYTIPSSGWLEVHVEGLPDPNLVGALWFGKSYTAGPTPVGSNDQSIILSP